MLSLAKRKTNRAANCCWLLAVMPLISVVQAASVGPSGYTNAFNTAVPSPGDWSTATITGGSGDVSSEAGLDGAVQLLTANGIASQISSDSGNPPAANALATWSSTGHYLQTRPTGVKMGVLMATLVNDTGTNADVINLNYDFTVASNVSEEVPGHRVYYSLTGAANTWQNIAALSSPPAGRVSAKVVLSPTWDAGAKLYLLWADDNGSGSPDDANQIDNFFISAYYTNFPLTIELTAPAEGQHIGAGSVISASVALTGTPTNVSYYVDGGLAIARTAAPFTPVTLPALTVGSHTVFATAQDASALVTTATNSFVVDLSLSGTLSADTTLHALSGPYTVSGSVTVPNGVNLTIEPGVTLNFNPGQSLIVADGGRLLAEGTSNAPIHFTRAGTSGYWGNLTIRGSTGSPETRIAYATFDFNSNDTGTPCIEVDTGSAYLDHLIFGQTGAPYIHVDGASFTICDCLFPTTTAQFEPCHGTRGVRSDGHGLFLRNFFGKATGYNDVVDFTGGNRPHPIVQFINNVVSGGDDDGFDIDGTDAWVEGNIFLHLHKNGGTPDSSSAVSGGNYVYSSGDPGGTGTETSQITIIRNLIFDCDQAADAKQGNFFTFYNNTIVHQSHIGGVDTAGAVVILADDGTTQGAGMYLEGNIIQDAEQLTRNVTTAIVTYTNNILSEVQGAPWTGLGGNNSTNDPILSHVPQLSETYFTNWASAQVMWDWFSLLPASPGIGTGPNGRDKGGVVPAGASISGVPTGTVIQTQATLTVGINRTGNGLPAAGWPNGSGYTAYKWRLDTNAWSSELPITTPISLGSLSDGAHHVEVIGKSDAGFYQNDPLFGPDATVTISPTWYVQSSFQLIPGTYDGTTFTLGLPAVTGNSYSILYRDGFDLAHPWTKLLDVPAPISTGLIWLTDTNAAPAIRFYRAITPVQP
jgi:hypothetical protein